MISLHYMIDWLTIMSKCDQYVDVGCQKLSPFCCSSVPFFCFENGSKIKVSPQKKKQIDGKTCSGPPNSNFFLSPHNTATTTSHNYNHGNQCGVPAYIIEWELLLYFGIYCPHPQEEEGHGHHAPNDAPTRGCNCNGIGNCVCVLDHWLWGGELLNMRWQALAPPLMTSPPYPGAQ